jgi:hypothetical protein
MDADDITRMVIEGEFGPTRVDMVPRERVEEVRQEVVAWLFGAKGAQSGLPF